MPPPAARRERHLALRGPPPRRGNARARGRQRLAPSTRQAAGGPAEAARAGAAVGEAARASAATGAVAGGGARARRVQSATTCTLAPRVARGRITIAIGGALARASVVSASAGATTRAHAHATDYGGGITHTNRADVLDPGHRRGGAGCAADAVTLTAARSSACSRPALYTACYRVATVHDRAPTATTYGLRV